MNSEAKNIEHFFCSTLEHVSNMLDTNSWDMMLCYVWDEAYFAIDIVKANIPFTYEDTRESLQQYHRKGHFETAQKWEGSIYESPYFSKKFERLEEIEDEEAWEREFETYTEERLSCLRRALFQSETFREHYPNDKYGVYAAIAPETVYEVNVIHLFGKTLPLPSPPKTSLEVFSRLFHAMESGVHEGGNVYFEHGTLKRVELKGTDFTDEKAFLLKEFESDVRRLCADLNVIDVRGGRVTEEALNYLKCLLPHVDIYR